VARPVGRLDKDVIAQALVSVVDTPLPPLMFEELSATEEEVSPVSVTVLVLAIPTGDMLGCKEVVDAAPSSFVVVVERSFAVVLGASVVV